MTNKASKIITLILCIFLIFGCSENEIKNSRMIHSFTFGLFGHDDFEFCREKIPNFIGRYSNNVEPTRVCRNYQYYICHITYYCNNNKKCEENAALIWLQPWRDIKTHQLVDPILATKKICEREQNQCNASSAKPNDQTCRR